MAYKITPSLFSAWQWYMSVDSATEEDFLKTLAREPFPDTEALLTGKKLEKDIQRFSVAEEGELGDANYAHIVAEMANRLKGHLDGNGVWQLNVKCEIDIPPLLLMPKAEVFLSGRIDYAYFDRIYDVKYTRNYTVGKYYPSIQHLAYCYMLGLPNFRYLVTDLKSVYEEDYTADTSLLRSRVIEFLNSIFGNEHWCALYERHWQW